MQDESCMILDDDNVSQVSITPQEYGNLLDIQQEILALTAQEADTQVILDKLCSMAQALLPNSVASLMLTSPESGLMYQFK